MDIHNKLTGLLLFACISISAQQPFYGTRLFVSADTQDTITINGSYTSGIDSFQVSGIWYKKLVTFEDTVNIIATRYDLSRKIDSVDRTIYVAPYPAGNDTTGDGTIGSPFHTILKALQDIKDELIDVTITIDIDSGAYDWGAENKNEFTRYEMYNSTIYFLGEFSLIESGFSMSQVSNFEYTLTKAGKTFTENEFKNKWISNGSRFFGCAYNAAGTNSVACIQAADQNHNRFYEDNVTITNTGDDEAFNIGVKVAVGNSRIIFEKLTIDYDVLDLKNLSTTLLFENVKFYGNTLQSTYDNLREAEPTTLITIRRSQFKVKTGSPAAIDFSSSNNRLMMHSTYVDGSDMGVPEEYRVVKLRSAVVPEWHENIIEGNSSISGIAFGKGTKAGFGWINYVMNCQGAVELEDDFAEVYNAGINDTPFRLVLYNTPNLFDCKTTDYLPPKFVKLTIDELVSNSTIDYFENTVDSEFVNLDKWTAILIGNKPETQFILGKKLVSDTLVLGDSIVTSIYEGVIPDEGRVQELISAVPGSVPDTIFVSGQNEWVGLNDTITKVDSSNLSLNSDNLNSQTGSYYLNRTNHTGDQLISTITDLQDSLNLFLERNDTIRYSDTALYALAVEGSSLPSGIQGDILFHNGVDWVVLNAGSSGYYLKTQGAAANPIWSSIPTSIPDTIFVSGQDEWIGINDTITKIDSANLALNSNNLNSQGGDYYLNRINHTGSQAISTITDLQDSLNLYAEIEDTNSYIGTKYDNIIEDDTIQAATSDTTYAISQVDFQAGTSVIYDSIVFASVQDIAFKSGSDYKYLYVSANDSINITNLPSGESILVLEQDGTGRTVKKGVGWGSLMGTGTISESADAVTIIQFEKILLPSGREIIRHFIISD